ncbi:hypothetical protein PXH66_10010 [Synoicihabitans lomoniglobus]|uniref:Uncharacterized protein n=1 Tax=Synoicihabitans lomoniglobus TaxID=2909285 RepID=A0AAF0I805_9BACT|nr:hypothetical protein PXH66_10010 [Opitutaceae bacterium LMO-M01]
MPPLHTTSAASGSRFQSPMPDQEDHFGPRYVPVWQPCLATLAAVASVGFAVLLYSKL